MKRLTLLMPLALPLLNSCGTEQSTQTESKPNIVFILADDLGYGDVHNFNAESKLSTVNLDKMAANGVSFTDAHTTSAVSTPSRYGVLTGRYNWRSSLKGGVVSGFSRAIIPSSRPTIASMLLKNGYQTAFIGKWHLGWDWDFAEDVDMSKIDQLEYNANVNYDKPVTNSPRDLGFDYYCGFCGSLDMPPYVWVENDTVVTPPNCRTISVDGKSMWRYGDTAPDFRHADILQDVTDKAINYIAESSKEDAPYFLYLPIPAPHTPILPNTEFLGMSCTNMYGDYVLQVDDVVGQLRAAIEATGEADNTIIVFTSDNGCSPRADFEELSRVGHDPSGIFRGMKSDLFEGGHRVPYIIEWGSANSNFKRGTVCDATICLTDFYATCAEIVGSEIDNNEAEDSFSLLSILEGEGENYKRENIVHHSIGGDFAVREGKWKLIFAQGSAGWSYPTKAQIKNQKMDLPALQLFDLESDPEEEVNLVNEYPEVVKSMTKLMVELIKNGRSTDGEVVKNDAPEEWWQAKAVIDLL